MASDVVVTYDFVQGTPANADDVDTNFADITTWINTNAAHLDGSKAFTGPVTLDLQKTGEVWSISATAATGTVNVNLLSNNAFLYTSNASANWTFNFRGDGSTTLDSILAVGRSVTCVVGVPQGATAYYASAFEVDGVSVTPKWPGGGNPVAGNVSSTEFYSFTIVKTAATPTYEVYATRVGFAP